MRFGDPSNAPAQPSVGARSTALCLKLSLGPYSVCANTEGSSETARMHRLLRAVAVRLCDKCTFHMDISHLLYQVACICRLEF